jgi:hypothetical protein
MTAKTLSELNAAPFRRTWGGWTLETRYHVGRSGSSRYGTSGANTHLVVAEYVVAKDGPEVAGQTKIGGIHSIHGACNGNGQRNGTVLDKLDTDAITCTKCLKRMGVSS